MMKIKNMIFATVCCVCLAVTGCNGNEAKESISASDTTATYQQISQDDAKKIMDEEENIVILDVRTQSEYESGHIKGAICIPNESISESVSDFLKDKDQTILVYCRSGNRSKQASQKLVDLGFTDVREFGGINTWQYETE